VPTERQRRETARRRLERQIERRQQAAAARRRRNLVTSAVLGVILVVGAVFLLVTQLGGDDDGTDAAAQPTPSASAPATPSATPTTAAVKGDCTYTKEGSATKDAGVPKNGKVATTGTATVAVQTTQGALTFTLDRSKAPCTVNSFLYLVGKKYFDGTPCHRVTTGANFGVLQCGDPGGTGTGGPGYKFGDELDPQGKYTKGVLAMANSGPNTNGSQFFIVYKDTQLAPNYTIFGTVSKGIDVVEKVAAGGSDNANGDGDGKPKTAISLTTLTAATAK
jgi:peptidyl-prolyl cis-trans isomerase B (cyclophilin B)